MAGTNTTTDLYVDDPLRQKLISLVKEQWGEDIFKEVFSDCSFAGTPYTRGWEQINWMKEACDDTD
jgi:hypothetical protein